MTPIYPALLWKQLNPRPLNQQPHFFHAFQHCGSTQKWSHWEFPFSRASAGINLFTNYCFFLCAYTANYNINLCAWFHFSIIMFLVVYTWVIMSHLWLFLWYIIFSVNYEKGLVIISMLIVDIEIKRKHHTKCQRRLEMCQNSHFFGIMLPLTQYACMRGLLMVTKPANAITGISSNAKMLVSAFHHLVVLFSSWRNIFLLLRYKDAINLLKWLLNCFTCDGRRGYWTLRLSINLEHIGCPNESLAVAEDGLQDPWVRAGSRMALQRRILRLGKPPRRWKTPSFSASIKRKITEVIAWFF